ncbi:MAG: TetR/AcrR family transcriptional regulator [Gemmatimonadaceae bacterium]|nr:TetR/AcrR family transcriptional regulator [Gemmatimonadaceae bacterium]
MSDTPAPYHHGDLRQALLDAARESLEREGAAALSLRALARRLGVSHNAPYRHFADREVLLDALCADGFARLADRLRHARGKTADDRLAAMGEAYVAFADQHPGLFALMFQPADPALRLQTIPVATDALAVLEGGIRDVTGEDDPVDVASLWALAHGLAQLRLNGHLLFGTPHLVRDVTRRTARALARRRPPAR